ncbi:hypothetical protein [Parasitella parasitica]|uniref:Uncharacterized protein n=1 Tax=Parasitella parasitica TaxID=35722 RepID=A0A0B7N5P0_9FUNG|nr:hypothetical protein [Parasitella parasitica]
MRLEQEKAGSSNSKNPGHINAKSRQCPHYKPASAEMPKKDFDGSMEQFIRKLYLKFVLGYSHKALFTDKIIKLGKFIRNVAFRSQLFLDHFAILNQDSDSLSAITQQNFWHSVSQLIMGQAVTSQMKLLFRLLHFGYSHFLIIKLNEELTFLDTAFNCGLKFLTISKKF